MKRIFEEQGLALIAKIGEGAFGEIFSAKNKITNEVVAIKLMNLSDSKNRRSFHRELQIAKQLQKAKNVIQFHSSNEISALNKLLLRKQQIGYVVMDKMDTDLIEYLLQRQRIDVKTTKKIFFQLCVAVNECHLRGVYHLDIKLDNVLIKFQNNNNNNEQSNCSEIDQIKLCDFGFATNERLLHPNSRFGTANYLPPEAFFHNENLISSEKVDVWSLGVSLFTLLSGLFPFLYENDRMFKNDIPSIIKYYIENQSEDNEVNQIIHLLEWIFLENPSLRPTVTEIINHPWFQN